MSEFGPELDTTYVNSPIGVLQISASARGVTALTLVEAMPNDMLPLMSNILIDTVSQIEAYFAGERQQFNLDYDLDHHSVFYRKVWSALLDIPYGQTISYGHLAQIIGDPKAAQAVGMANAKNPIDILIPCHRVLGGDGSLTGYAWGVEKKRWLLLHERGNVPVPEGQLF